MKAYTPIEGSALGDVHNMIGGQIVYASSTDGLINKPEGFYAGFLVCVGGGENSYRVITAYDYSKAFTRYKVFIYGSWKDWY